MKCVNYSKKILKNVARCGKKCYNRMRTFYQKRLIFLINIGGCRLDGE